MTKCTLGIVIPSKVEESTMIKVSLISSVIEKSIGAVFLAKVNRFLHFGRNLDQVNMFIPPLAMLSQDDKSL